MLDSDILCFSFDLGWISNLLLPVGYYSLGCGTSFMIFEIYVFINFQVAAPDMIQKNYQWTNFFQRPIVPRLFLLMLIMLVCLHVFWTILLFRIAYKSTQKGEDLDDIRGKYYHCLFDLKIRILETS
jgi:hypothetical protein